MSKLLMILALLPISASATEIRITGAAAMELYNSLNLPEVSVVDEHTGMPYGMAKYGKNVGCERDLENTSAYCWFRNQ